MLLQKFSLIRVIFCTKLCLGMARHAISLLFHVFVLIYYSLWFSSFILLREDFKTSPGPISSSEQCFLICHWNLNDIAAHNYTKLSLLSAYNLLHSFDIICLSETYLNSETPPNDIRLELPGYNMFRSDHPSIKEKECLYLL